MIINNRLFIIYVLSTLLSNKVSATTTDKDISKALEEHTMVTDINIFPYMVAILRKFTYISAGALIDESWVLTEADSLFTIRESSRFLRVRLGSANYKKGGYLTPIKYFQIHPYFDDSKPLFDVALIKLPEAVRLTLSINPIRLQKKPRKIITSHFIVTSWPVYQQQNLSASRVESLEQKMRRRILTVSHLHPTDPEVCSEEMDMFMPDHNNTKSLMCLDPNIGTNPCQRDIGAPVVLNGLLWGIISSWKSEECEIEGGPSFVTLVSSVEVNSWIHSTIHGHRWMKQHTVDYQDNFI
ncbi:hypodermin-B-like [Maniola jurtina]|uniref:hypodermin-B-like n=1 Tax=Maniola jurtina TaxID=191418 RepID=UPI001E68F33B|nr:hypodermin-B-like [Maniola jurtina]